MTADAKYSAFENSRTVFTIATLAFMRNRNLYCWLLTGSESDSPHASRNRARCGRLTSQQSFDMKVFIDIGPMHFIAVWPEFIVAALLGRGVQ